jgi:hypothetical protein
LDVHGQVFVLTGIVSYGLYLPNRIITADEASRRANIQSKYAL